MHNRPTTTFTASPPQGYFNDEPTGRTLPPRVSFNAATGTLTTSCDVDAGALLWEESCEAVFGSFDPHNRSAQQQAISATADRAPLVSACPSVLANALISKTSGGSSAGLHPLHEWLEGYDLAQRVLLQRTRRLMSDDSTSSDHCVGHLQYPATNAPLLGACGTPVGSVARWAQQGAAGDDVAVPVGVASMLAKGLERAAQLTSGISSLAHDVGYLMYLGQHRRLLLCKGSPDPGTAGSFANSKNADTPWSSYGIFPFCCHATQVRLKDAANCVLTAFVAEGSVAISLRCVAAEALPRGTQVRILCPRNGLLDENSGCVASSSALQPGALLHSIRCQVLDDTKPWRAVVNGQLSVIDEKLKAMLRQR